MATLGHKLSVIDTEFESKKPCYEDNCSLEESEKLIIEKDHSTIVVNPVDDKLTDKLIQSEYLK